VFAGDPLIQVVMKQVPLATLTEKGGIETPLHVILVGEYTVVIFLVHRGTTKILYIPGYENNIKTNIMLYMCTVFKNLLKLVY